MRPHANRWIRAAQWLLIYAILAVIVLLITSAESIITLLLNYILP